MPPWWTCMLSGFWFTLCPFYQLTLNFIIMLAREWAALLWTHKIPTKYLFSVWMRVFRYACFSQSGEIHWKLIYMFSFILLFPLQYFITLARRSHRVERFALSASCFNCFLKPEMLSMVLMAWGSLFHSVGAATMKLHNPERLFGLDEEIDSQLPHVWSLCVRRLYLNNIR